MLHSNRDAQLDHLTRSGIPCECCGRAIPQFKPQARRLTPDGLHYTEIVRRFSGHIDHKVPLWKVTHVEERERIKYFGPGNLQILCEKCHAIKTAREATERAHYARLAQKSSTGQKSKPSKRIMRSRGFDKRFRRKLSGQVTRRL
jgi:5-methylcytosine-specific restriction endonuclease McrA